MHPADSGSVSKMSMPTAPPPSRLFWLKMCLLTVFMTAAVPAATPVSEADYLERVEKAQLGKYPQNHKALAEWCKRQYPLKSQFHLDAWNAYDFGRLEKLLPAAPAAQDYQRMASTAAKMGMKDKEREYRGKWGEAQYAVFSKKLVAGNTAMMKQLLDWAIKEKVDSIPACQELAGRIISTDPACEPARRALKHLKLAKGWVTWEEALAGIDLQQASQRLEIHKAAAAYWPVRTPGDYPRNPTQDMQPGPRECFRAATKKSGGKANYFIWTKNYSREKPCALVLGLHGGGEGGVEKSIQDAPIEAHYWQQNVKEGSWVLLCPTARNHISNSWWNKDNLEDIFDMLDETVERFNIDKKRIYVTGTSMGGNGTGEWMWAFPEFAAASCSRAGAYWTNWTGMKDVLGKPIMVIHGEQDEEARNKTRDEFVSKTEAFGGKVTHISYPDQGHFLKAESVWPKMIPFFLQHTNDLEPDFRLLREVFRDRHKKYPQT